MCLDKVSTQTVSRISRNTCSYREDLVYLVEKGHYHNETVPVFNIFVFKTKLVCKETSKHGVFRYYCVWWDGGKLERTGL